jgi:hypothetical protein
MNDLKHVCTVKLILNSLEFCFINFPTFLFISNFYYEHYIFGVDFIGFQFPTHVHMGMGFLMMVKELPKWKPIIVF